MPSTASKPRLRFAPSPTGYLHIGGVRTALFNWLWARKTGGSFILRIEDTDVERSTLENEEVILRDMRWLGLHWDEGPGVGGPNGPYRQMERLPIYAEFATKLIGAGAAYRCFCTKEELDAQREEQLRALRAEDPKAESRFRYPGTCRDKKPPFPDRPSVLRLRAPTSGSVDYRDLVFGDLSTPNTAQQDVVLMRSDGVPLYNLGAVVDDVTMGVTLVARGSDHLINTPVQILLYRGLGLEPPAFAHLPMMLGQNGKKLSKRDGAVSVAEYRDMGVPPAGLLNYLVRFGWSYGDEEIFSMAELTSKFDWERCGKGDGKFDPKRLLAVSFEHLKRADLTSLEAYADGVTPFLEKRGLTVSRKLLLDAIPTVRERADTFAEAAAALDYLFRDPPAYEEKAVKKFLVPDKAARLREFRDLLAAADDFSVSGLDTRVSAWLAKEGIELKVVAQSVRVALTGKTASPGLYEVLALLGRERALARLDHALSVAIAVGTPHTPGQAG